MEPGALVYTAVYTPCRVRVGQRYIRHYMYDWGRGEWNTTMGRFSLVGSLNVYICLYVYVCVWWGVGALKNLVCHRHCQHTCTGWEAPVGKRGGVLHSNHYFNSIYRHTIDKRWLNSNDCLFVRVHRKRSQMLKDVKKGLLNVI